MQTQLRFVLIYNVKDAIKSFVSYKPNSKEYRVKLDANESNVNLNLLQNSLCLKDIHLYPSNHANSLKEKLSRKFNVDSSEVIVGSGSSELLELVVKTYINPNDIVLSVEPSFVMYKKYTIMNNGVYISIPVNENCETDINSLIKKAKEINPKIIFLCTPNNPTGSMIPKEDVIRLLDSTNALVVVDEAYMEFASSNQSVIDLINNYPNVIINRTFSKAYAIAGARLGYMIANKNIINQLYLIKTPYSVSTLTQELGELVIDDVEYLKNNVETVKKEKKRFINLFNTLGIRYFTSETNFFYIQFTQCNLANELEEKGILIRDFKNTFYRITIGNKKQNNILFKALEDIINEDK